MEFMFFNLADGRPVAVRREAIAVVFPVDKESEECTTIFTIGDKNTYFTVRESYKNVMSRLEYGVSRSVKYNDE